jgi:hypothetical protein
MIAKAFPLFLMALSGGVSAQILARLVPQNLTERAVRPSGGLAIIPEKYCPDNLDNCGNGAFCCPTSLTCATYAGDYNDGFCCSGSKQHYPTLSEQYIIFLLQVALKLTF